MAYIILTEQTLLHWNQPLAVMYELFLVFRLSDLWKRWKKHSFHNKHIYMLYGSQTFWSFMKFYFIHMVKVRFVFKKSVIVLMFLHICIKHSKHLEMWKSNSKLNFTKNHWVSWFSCGLLKISKCSISLAWLGECSKIKVTTELANTVNVQCSRWSVNILP